MDFTHSRKELFGTYSSSPNHNMVFTGIDIVGGKPKKWLVEILALFTTSPEKLPRWDPLFHTPSPLRME